MENYVSFLKIRQFIYIFDLRNSVLFGGRDVILLPFPTLYAYLKTKRYCGIVNGVTKPYVNISCYVPLRGVSSVPLTRVYFD